MTVELSLFCQWKCNFYPCISNMPASKFPPLFWRSLSSWLYLFPKSWTNGVLITQRVCFLLTNFNICISHQIIFSPVMLRLVKIILCWNSPGSDCRASRGFVEQGWVIILGVLEMGPTPSLLLSPPAAWGIYFWFTHEDKFLPQMFAC